MNNDHVRLVENTGIVLRLITVQNCPQLSTDRKKKVSRRHFSSWEVSTE